MELTQIVQFRVLGDPLPKQSFRATRGGGFTDPRIKAWQNTVSWEARRVMAGRQPLEGRLAAELTFFRRTLGAVDLDNLSKAALDGMQGIVFLDDKQIYQLRAMKLHRAPEPMLKAIIWKPDPQYFEMPEWR